MSRRHFCYTINFAGLSEEHVGRNCKGLVDLDYDNCRYHVAQVEKGDNGTVHIQGYIEFTVQMSLVKLKALNESFARAHWEGRRGSREQARDYAMKEDTRSTGPFVNGVWAAGPGSRTDLEVIKQYIDDECKEGTFTMCRLYETHFATCAKHWKFFTQYANMKAKKRCFATEVHVIWGETGIGKTRRAVELCEDNEYYKKPPGQWFDGYDGETHVLFDDFYGGEMKPSMFLQVTDRYPMRVPYKGGFRNWSPKVIYITSNVSPNDWWSSANLPESVRQAIRRRFTSVTHMQVAFGEPQAG